MPKRKGPPEETGAEQDVPVEEVELETKTEPSQDRARTTFEKILTVTGDLLGEVGFERLSTNMICKRAGITPPALYRYFPNKYAVIHALGERLGRAQEKIVVGWAEGGGLDPAPFPDIVQSFIDLLTRVSEQNKQFPGGVWVVRVIRVTPLLKGVRLATREYYAGPAIRALQKSYPEIPEERLGVITRLMTDIMYAAAELVMDEPQDEQQIIFETSMMMASYYEKMNQLLRPE